MEATRIALSGLVDGTLCQKTRLTFEEVVNEWNSTIPDNSNHRTVRLSINHYTSKRSKGESEDFLLMVEPRVTWPRHSSALQAKYRGIFAANSESATVTCKPWLNEPLPDGEIPRSLPIALPELFTVIAANKMSAVPGELYSLRRRVADYAKDLTVIYGAGWDSNFFAKLKVALAEFAIAIAFSKSVSLRSFKLFFKANWTNYRGLAESKTFAYSKTKFALVIENSMELRTEKLFDAIEAGAFPVYVGPRCDDGIPETLFIHAEPTLEGIMEAMRAARQINFDDWWIRRLSWIDSPAHKTSSKDRFIQLLKELSGNYDYL